MIYGADYVGIPGYIDEYKTNTADVLSAGFQEAISDNPYTKMLDYIELETQTGGSLDFVSDEPPRIVSKQEAERRARESGVTVQNIPEEGLNEGALSLLVERQYQKKLRRETINAAGSGFKNSAAELIGGFAGSMVDPLNVAASFIPVVGQARYAKWVQNASGPMGRLGVRLGVGALEGAVGAVAMEPASYMLSQELGDDYTMTDSLLNIAFGTAMGGGLHATIGGLGDAIEWKKGQKNSNAGKVANQLDNASPETRMAYAQTAVAQAAEDRRINVDVIRDAHVLDVQQKVADLDQKLTAAMAVQDEASIKLLSEQKSALLTQLEPSSMKAADMEVKASELVESEIRNMLEEIKAAEVNSGLVDTADGGKNRFYDNTYPEWYKEVGAKNKDDFAKIIESKSGTRYEKLKAMAEERLSNGYESKQFGQIMPDDEFRKLRGLDPITERPTKNLMEVERGLKNVAEEAPDSRFIDEKLEQTQLAEMSDDSISQMTPDELKALADEEFALLKEDADQLGIDIEEIAEVKAADDILKATDEQSKMLRAMAICAARKG